jgi:hypothetical protein
MRLAIALLCMVVAAHACTRFAHEHSTKTTSVTITETCKTSQDKPSKTCVPPSRFLFKHVDDETTEAYDFGPDEHTATCHFKQPDHGPQGLYDIIVDYTDADGKLLPGTYFLALCTEAGLAKTSSSWGPKAVHIPLYGWCATTVFKYDCNDLGKIEVTPEGLECDRDGVAEWLALDAEIDSRFRSPAKAKTTATGAAHPRRRRDEL